MFVIQLWDATQNEALVVAFQNEFLSIVPQSEALLAAFHAFFRLFDFVQSFGDLLLSDVTWQRDLTFDRRWPTYMRQLTNIISRSCPFQGGSCSVCLTVSIVGQ